MSNQAYGNIDNLGSYLDSANIVANQPITPEASAALDQTTINTSYVPGTADSSDPLSAMYSVFAAQYNQGTSNISVTVPGYPSNSAAISVNPLALYAALGSNPTFTETYTENFPTATKTAYPDIDLQTVADYFNSEPSTQATSPGGAPSIPNTSGSYANLTVDFNTPQGALISSWWSSMYPSGPAISTIGLNQVVGFLAQSGYLTVTTSPSAAEIQALNSDPTALFNTEMNLFLQNYSKVGIQPPDPQNFAQAFLSYMGNDTQLPANYPPIIPVQFVNSTNTAGGTNNEGFVLSSGNYYFNTGTNRANVGYALPLTMPPSTGVYSAIASDPDPVSDIVTNFQNLFVNGLNANVTTSPADPSTNPDSWFAAQTPTEQTQIFNNAFANYVTYLTGTQGQSLIQLGDSSSNFFQDFSNIAGPLAVVNDPTTGLSGLASYQAIWNVYYPNDPTDFIPAVTAFINSQVGPATSFTTSTLLGAWFKQLRTETIGKYGGEMLADGGYDQITIILKIYNQIVQLLGNIQVLAGAQLNRETFYNNLQNAYTTLEQQLTSATPTGGSINLSGYGSAGSPANNNVQRRSDVSQLVSAYTESIKSYRSEIQDINSEQGTAVSQSQQSVSSQLNVAQTLIQQFSTLLQSIWR